jgi:beta-lactamase regulating signal transducer with metallopeptidase domain
MTAIEIVLQQPAAQAVGWTLLHFIWQGALVGGLTAIALAMLHRSASDVRYVVAAIGLSLMVTLPAVTVIQVWRSTTGGAASFVSDRTSVSSTSGIAVSSGVSRTRPPVADSANPTVTNAEIDRRPVASIDALRVEPWLPVFVIVWCCGVVILTLRLMSGWFWVQRMKSRGTGPVAEALQQTAARLVRRLHIRRHVRLLQSTLVDVPTVIGWLRPVVLVPISALSGLSPDQLEAVLAHELAHVRRHDYLVNLVQTLVETLLFYHPAVWWISHQIRIERENCCDDLAVNLCGDPYAYARALADLEQLRGSNRQLVLAATGGSLLQRVRRLLGAPSHAGRAPGWLAGTAAIVLMLAIAAGAVVGDAFQGSQATPPATASTRPATRDEPKAAAQAGQQTEQAQTAAAAEGMRRQADIYRLAASRIQQATGQATTPLIAGQTLAAKADAFNDAALSMAAEARRNEPVIASTPDQQHRRDVAIAASTRAFASEADALSASAAAATISPKAGLAIGGEPSAVNRAQRQNGNFSWSNNGDKLEVKYDGEIEFTDDETDVQRLSPGGSLRIREGGWIAGRTVEFTADGTGNITRRFFVGMVEKPFDPDGRAWLKQTLPRFIRQTGIGAPARVARFLKSGGTNAVLAEITKIEGSWAKRVYFKELLAQATLDASAARQVLVQAGREIDSDFELASLLTSGADKLLLDDATRQAYFDATRTIGSDFEMHRVYSAALKRGAVSPAVLAGILDASRNIDSDFEQASLLVQIAKLQPLDKTTRGPFFAALATVGSDFEHHRVLTALAQRTDLDAETATAMLDSVAAIDSDFEAASFLVQLAKVQPIEGSLRAPFFRAVDSLQSAFERGRVLKGVVTRTDASKETVLGVLRAAKGMNSGFETSQVLLAIASAHPLSGDARDAYIDAAEKLGDFEQGRVLAALVKNERRVR